MGPREIGPSIGIYKLVLSVSSIRLYNMANCSSDHNMLILKALPLSSSNKRRQRLFRFEAMWIKEEECDGVVKEAWERGRTMGNQNQFDKCMIECRTLL